MINNKRLKTLQKTTLKNNKTRDKLKKFDLRRRE